LPDFAGYRAEGKSVDAALESEKALARTLVSGSNTETSKPRGLMEIRDDPTWARDRGIDWHDAIVVMVEI
jgi:hypothetical protein